MLPLHFGDIKTNYIKLSKFSYEFMTGNNRFLKTIYMKEGKLIYFLRTSR